MLFLFRGHNSHVIKAVLGAVLLAVGLILHHEALLAGIGAVLIVWGAFGALSAQRTRRRNADDGGRAS
ncbi:MAG TPA: hypothetical protein VGH27_32675 [Streptosporangiaceae bacterium]